MGSHSFEKLALLFLAAGYVSPSLTHLRLETTELGYCKQDDDCKVVNSWCNITSGNSQGDCQCRMFFVEYTLQQEDECGEGVRCLPYPGSRRPECSVHLQCHATLGKFSKCNNGICECTPTEVTEYRDGRGLMGCGVPQRLGEVCDATFGHYSCIHNPHGRCAHNGTTWECRCAPGWTFNRISSEGGEGGEVKEDPVCVVLTKKVGGSCAVHPVQCEGVVNSVCDTATTKCLCPEGYLISSDSEACLQRKGLGERCEEYGQCSEHSSCLNSENGKKCQCSGGFIESKEAKEKCVQIATKIGEPCSEMIQCSHGLGNNVECSENLCKCTNGTLPSPSQSRCYPPAANLGDECETSEQCRLGASDIHRECGIDLMTKSATCHCPEGTVRQNTTCYPVKRIWDKCTSAEECRISITGSRVDCVEMRCICLDEDVPSSDLRQCFPQTVPLGGVCVESSQCRIEGDDQEGTSYCDLTKKCSCKSGYKANVMSRQCELRKQWSSMGPVTKYVNLTLIVVTLFATTLIV